MIPMDSYEKKRSVSVLLHEYFFSVSLLILKENVWILFIFATLGEGSCS